MSPPNANVWLSKPADWHAGPHGNGPVVATTEDGDRAVFITEPPVTMHGMVTSTTHRKKRRRSSGQISATLLEEAGIRRTSSTNSGLNVVPPIKEEPAMFAPPVRCHWLAAGLVPVFG